LCLFGSAVFVHFSNLSVFIKRFVSVPNSVKSVDYVAGASEGLVRLENAVVASFMVAKMTSEKSLVDGKLPELSTIEGPRRGFWTLELKNVDTSLNRTRI
jgi:hypothetical protein